MVSGSLTGTKGTMAKPAGKCASLVAEAPPTTGTLTTIAGAPRLRSPTSVLTVKSVTRSGPHGSLRDLHHPGLGQGIGHRFVPGHRQWGATDKSVAQTMDTVAATARLHAVPAA